MPIAGEYSWSEKKDRVLVSVPLKGTSPNKVDIYVTRNTLKVNYSPYLLDFVLKSGVDSVKHKATVKEGVLVITLLKETPGVWGDLLSDVKDKATLQEIKKFAVDGQTQKEKELHAERKDMKIDEEKHALRKQMKLDESERTLIETLKQDEKETAEAAMYKTFADMEKQKLRSAHQKEKEAPSIAVATNRVHAKVEKAVKLSGEQKEPTKNDIFVASDLTPLEQYLQNDDIDVDDDENIDIDPTEKSEGAHVFTKGTATAATAANAKEAPTHAPEDIDEGEG